MYEIAGDLYQYKKMPNETQHNFLYDHILNVVAKQNNASSIGTAMLNAMQVGSKSDSKYAQIQKVWKDIKYSARCTNGYAYKTIDGETTEGYTQDTEFKSIELDKEGTAAVNQFMEDLNQYTGTDYNTISDWVRGCVGKDIDVSYGGKTRNLKNYQGMYPLVKYDWDSNLDKDYGKTSQ